MSQVIEIIISLGGETKLETKRFAGASRQIARKVWEQALGNVVREKKTAEFYRCNRPTNNCRNRAS